MYRTEEAKKAIDILKNLGTPCLIHQPSYSMLNRWIEDELIDVLEEEGVGSIAFSPLAGGKLTNRYLNGIPKDSRAASDSIFMSENDITEELVTKVNALNEVAIKRGQSLAQMALAWDLKVGKLTSVLIGASKVSQIEDCVKALDCLDFTEEELKTIDEILKA